MYVRLGFENQDNKNQYTPEIVKQRRANFLRNKNSLGKDIASKYEKINIASKDNY